MKFLTIYRKIKETVENLCKQLNIREDNKATGRPRSLTTKEVITLMVYKHKQGIPTKKAIWKDFGLSCSYKTFVVSVNRHILVITKLLMAILQSNRKNAHAIKYTDATDIPVCLNKNAKHHKTMQSLATWGRNSKGFFYGLKLHLSADYKGRILSIAFTPANTDDRKPFMRLNKELYGVFVADAGYISKKLADEFNIEYKRLLIAKPKANMKKIATPLQNALYSSRSRIEKHFNNTKKFYGLVSSLSRSVDGYIGNYMCSLLAHVLA
jgi:IS5 family transposase